MNGQTQTAARPQAAIAPGQPMVAPQVTQSQAAAFRATGVPGGTSPMYGLGGLFGVCDADPTVINAMVGPIGVERALTWRGSDVQSPLYDSLVWMGSSGFDQTGLCADCGKPSFKECTQSACFGRICQMTNEHAVDQIGLRGRTTTPRISLFGNITDPSGNVLVAQGQEISDMFTLELAGAAYNLRYRVGWMMWNGNPVANAGGAWQFPGFPLLYNTGKFDVRTNVTCSALDSTLIPFNGIVGVAGQPSIYAALMSLVLSVNQRITGMDKNPSDSNQFFIMSPRHWEVVSRAIACEYGLVCGQSAGAEWQDARERAEFWNELVANAYIPIFGRKYPVVVDNVMPYTTQYYGDETAFCQDIYFVTESLEGMTILYGEYQDFNMTAGDTLAWFRSMFGSSPVSVTDNGRYVWAPTTFGGFCFDARLLVKPRVIALMTQLGGRVTDVCVLPLGRYKDVTGSGGLYEDVGGISHKPYLGMYGYCGALGGQVVG